MEIKDITVEQTIAKDGDYLVLQDPVTGIGYKITRGNFLAGLSGSINSTLPLLDGISGIVSARSIRQLLSAYTGKILQVKLTDGSIKDIDCISGMLDTAILKTFTGSSSAIVNNFYDQVGAFATISTSPPKIIDAGTLQTAGSKPTLSYSSNFLSIPITVGYPITVIAAIKISNSTGGAFIKYGADNNGIGIGCGSGTFDSAGMNLIGLNEAISWIGSNTAIPTSQMSIIEINSTGNSTNLYLNGNLVVSGGGSNAPSGNYNLGGYGSRLCNCNISEDIVFNQIISSETRKKMVSNMMNYYGIT